MFLDQVDEIFPWILTKLISLALVFCWIDDPVMFYVSQEPEFQPDMASGILARDGVKVWLHLDTSKSQNASLNNLCLLRFFDDFSAKAGTSLI